jgi:hypothetical protein
MVHPESRFTVVGGTRDTSGRQPAQPGCATASGVFGAPLSRKLEKRNSYLVDPASSHMLVSKIKPCMCKYKLFCTVKLRMAH